jgi:hypothetical protein
MGVVWQGDQFRTSVRDDDAGSNSLFGGITKIELTSTSLMIIVGFRRK